MASKDPSADSSPTRVDLEPLPAEILNLIPSLSTGTERERDPRQRRHVTATRAWPNSTTIATGD